MSKERAMIHVIDDEEAICEALSSLFRSVDYSVACYSSADRFIEAELPKSPGCIVTDVRLPGTSGLELQDYLARLAIGLPVVLMTGFGDIQMVVRAMKAGAIDFLTKPYRDQDMLDAVALAIEKDRKRRQGDEQREQLQARRGTLSPRERQTMDLVVTGLLNKQVAAELGISETTVKVYRAAAMKKMGAASFAQLARMAEILEIAQGESGRPASERSEAAARP